jgi:hypothetical protein
MNTALKSFEDAAVMDGQSRYAGDSRLHVNFYTKAVQNNFQSKEQGRPIFEDKEFIRIIVPGDKNSIVDTPVTQEHRNRFATKYERFKAGKAQATTGTPLEVWPQLTVSQVAELKGLNVFTVEQLADMPDNLAQRFMGAHNLRARAKLFLEAAAGESANSRVAAELEKRDVEIQALKEQVALLMAPKAAVKA